ncbi:hypothetical protein LEMLEM_LOCUS22831 [Lemmus lemmus]
MGDGILMISAVLHWKEPGFQDIVGVVPVVPHHSLRLSVLVGAFCFVVPLCLASDLVPILEPRIFSSSKWTTKEPQSFHDTSSNLVKIKAGLWAG